MGNENINIMHAHLLFFCQKWQTSQYLFHTIFAFDLFSLRLHGKNIHVLNSKLIYCPLRKSLEEMPTYLLLVIEEQNDVIRLHGMKRGLTHFSSCYYLKRQIIRFNLDILYSIIMRFTNSKAPRALIKLTLTESCIQARITP